jgi:LysR family transcriptional regulator, transcriptional activator of nhaA
VEWLNYHHLLYFWLVAREGGLAGASKRLRLAQSTISGQIKALERSMGERVFVRSGRRLVLTEVGRLVFRYADEIFALGSEMQDALRGRSGTRPLDLVVGIADVVPKLVARRLLEPATRLAETVRLVCREDKPERLLSELAIHNFDVVILDGPLPASVRIRAFSHLLGETGVEFFGPARLAEQLRGGFPRCLDGAPMLLPTDNTSLRRSLDPWFELHGIRPHVVAEFEDGALLSAFGQAGHGIFPVPSVVARDVQRQGQLRRIGTVPDVRERYYAVSLDRRLKHPALVAIQEEARQKLFG